MEKVLPYSRGEVTQDTIYNCGPASVQTIVRSTTNRLISEAELGKKLRTHTGGTDYIGQFPAVLNQLMPGAAYVHRDYPRYMGQSDKDALWMNLTRSIDAGYGAVINICAPPSNYPKAVYPSTISPRYAGGTVYHYVAAMGYSTATKDNPVGTRKIWIADSGFYPYGYWISFEQLCSLIVPKGVAYATSTVATPTAPVPVGTYYDVDWAKKFGFGNPRSASAIEGVCLHTTENAAGTPAENVANWQLTMQNGSYQMIVDTRPKKLRCNTDDWRVHASGNRGNDIYVHLAFVAYASWTRAQWLAEMPMLEAGADVVAYWCKTHNIPPRRIDAGKGRGITTHDSTRKAWGGTTHTDPGPNFPWDVFLPMVAKRLDPTTKEAKAMDEAIAKQILERLTNIELQLMGPTPAQRKAFGMPVNPAGGRGWPQCGQNAKGQDLTLVDAVANLRLDVADIKEALND